MKKIDLFPSRIYKIKIDPLSFNKREILDIIEKNYTMNIKEYKNEDGPFNTINNYFNNWNNKNFQKLPLDNLSKIYDDLIKKFIDDLDFCYDYKYKWELVNINVGNGFMEQHDHLNGHLDEKCYFVMSHFLSFDEKIHSNTTFINPTFVKKLKDYNFNFINKFKDDNISLENTIYLENYEIKVQEDDVLIFPGYLEHSVYPSKKESQDKLRVVTIANINIK